MSRWLTTKHENGVYTVCAVICLFSFHVEAIFRAEGLSGVGVVESLYFRIDLNSSEAVYLDSLSSWAGNRLSRSGAPTAGVQIQPSSSGLPGAPRRQPGIAVLLALPC
jgi:hypothetical protein